MSESIKTITLSGHKNSVLSLATKDIDCGTPSAFVLSGSEDGQMRFWDSRIARTVRGFVKVFEGNPVNSVVFHPINDNFVFAASQNKVYKFDLRLEGVCLSDAKCLAISKEDEDEINELVFNRRNGSNNKGKLNLAAANDSGFVRFIDPETMELHRKQPSIGHENICTSVRFHPTRKNDILTGGMDYGINFYNIDTGKKRANYQVKPFDDDSSISNSSTNNVKEKAPPMFNPPFVHSIDITDHGRVVAAGVGDGSVRLIDYQSQTLLHQYDAHSSATCQVLFPHCWTRNNGKINRDSTNNEKLISVGSNGHILLWKLPEMITSGIKTVSKKKEKKYKTKKKEVVENGRREINPSLLLDINHATKPNSITVSSANGGSIYVADTSNIIRIYQGILM